MNRKKNTTLGFRIRKQLKSTNDMLKLCENSHRFAQN